MKKLALIFSFALALKTSGQNNPQKSTDTVYYDLGNIVMVEETQIGDISYPPCKNDLYRHHLKGNVFIASQYAECIQCSESDKDQNYRYLKFSPDGKELARYESPTNSQFNFYQFIYEFDTIGYKVMSTTIESHNFDPEKTTHTTTFEYDQIGNLIKERQFKLYGEPEYVIDYQYNDQCELVETITESSNGDRIERISINYENNTRTHYDSNDAIISIHHFDLDRNDVKIDFPNSSKPSISYLYEYDSNKNWTKKTQVVDGQAEVICYRNIQYYDHLLEQQTATAAVINRGHLKWCAENLQVKQFRNGDIIPQAQHRMDWYCALYSKTPAWCYSESEFHPENPEILYNSYAVRDPRQLAPNRYRIATEKDWLDLFDHWGGKGKSFVIMHENKDKKFHANCAFGHREGHIFLLESGWWTAERYCFHVPIDFPGEAEMYESEEFGGGLFINHDRREISCNGYLVRCVRE